MRRWPAVSKVIKEIKEEDKRVKIAGLIVAMEPASGKITIDDGTGSIDVFFNSLDVIEQLENYKPGDQVMVIGWATESGIDGEVLRRIIGFDPSRYRQVLEVWSHVRSKTERSNDISESDESSL